MNSMVQSTTRLLTVDAKKSSFFRGVLTSSSESEELRVNEVIELALLGPVEERGDLLVREPQEHMGVTGVAEGDHVSLSSKFNACTRAHATVRFDPL